MSVSPVTDAVDCSTVRRAFLAGFATLLSAGCVSLPSSSYRKVDRKSPAFTAAVALEESRLQADGQSREAAEAAATKTVSGRMILEEKNRRLVTAEPLLEALAAFGRPSGCWAFTLTETIQKQGRTTVLIGRYDPFQLPETEWTLISQDAKPPNQEMQDDYRVRQRQQAKRLTREFDRLKDRKTIGANVIMWDFAAKDSDDTGESRYTTHIDLGMDAPINGLVMKMPPWDSTYLVDRARHFLKSYATNSTGTFQALVGALKLDRSEKEMDFFLIDSSLPPFLGKIVHRYRQHIFGVDSGEIIEESVYSDYRRVTCYGDRFGVKIGPPSLLNYLPAKN